MADIDFHMRFWGVRGTIACPGDDYSEFGGNTSCIEVRCRDRLIVLDAGTGLRPLGVELEQKGAIDVDLLLTHTHLDHLAGMPFFVPMFKPGNRIRTHSGHLWDQPESLRDVLVRMTAAPLFPIPIEALSAELSFHEFRAGEQLDLGDQIEIKTAPLNHPNNATGYRIEFAGKSICYVTDTEHIAGELDQNILDLIDGTDIFIYDATYTDDEYPQFKGWGHSTWQEGARLAQAAGVGRYVIFHHAPEHMDPQMRAIEEAALRVFDRTLVAREGMKLTP